MKIPTQGIEITKRLTNTDNKAVGMMQNRSRKPYNRPKPLLTVANGNKQNDDVM